MARLGIVTYMRADEHLTRDLVEIGNALRRDHPDLIMEIYHETGATLPSLTADFAIRTHHTDGTKYRKLLHALHESDYEYLLSLDNDIKANIPGLIRLVGETLAGSYDLAWGRVSSRQVNNFTSHLVQVDKLISHNLLRPLLWRLNLGVTIPGQCFLLRTAAFKNRLSRTDTYLDDLSIGVYAARNKLRYRYSHEIVAFELPSYSFSALWRQRARWAMGFRQTLSCPQLTAYDRRLLWVHASVYHLLPMLHCIFLAALGAQHPILGFAWLGLMAGVIAMRRPRSIAAAAAYQLIFPVFHMGWLIHFIKAKK